MRSRQSRILFACAAGAVAFQLASPLVIALQGPQLATGAFATQSDAARYREIVESPGTPYRDFQVEYPPLALGLFRALGPDNFGGFRQRLLALEAASQALIVFVLFKVWGKRAMWSYLALSTPMLFVVYTGFDLIAIALTVVATALVRLERPLAGAVGFVVGAFTKLWPVVVLPSVLIRGKQRVFAAGVAIGVLGLGAWSAWGGNAAIGQVVSYRGATGWEFESLPGSLLRLSTRDRLGFSKGAWRVGGPPRLLTVAITVVLMIFVAGIWRFAGQRPGLPDGTAETAAITSLLVFGTLLSPQFLIWPLPFVAIAAASGAKKLEPWAAAAAILTLMGSVFWNPYQPAALRTEILILGRNLAIIGLLAVAVGELRKQPERDGPGPARRPHELLRRVRQ